MFRKTTIALVSTVFAFGVSTASAAPISLEEIVNLTTTGSGSLVNDGLDDAFDGAFGVSGFSGLSISRRIDTLGSIQTYRVLDSFTNNTVSTISTTVTWATNLGSDGGEFVVTEGSPRAITFEDFSAPSGSPVGDYDPVLAFTFGNNAFTLANGVGDVSPNAFDLDFDLTIEAGETVSILQYATLIKDDTDRSGDVALATLRSDDLISSPDLSGLSAGQVATIANFSAIPEPSMIAVFGLGLVGLGFARRRKTTA